MDHPTNTLNAEQQAWLLALARQVLAATAAGRKVTLPAPADPALQEQTAVFVTLWQQTAVVGAGNVITIGEVARRIEEE